MTQEIITTESALDNFRFQDWLVKVKLMQRNGFRRTEPYGVELKPDEEFASRSQSYQRSIDMLVDNRGYVVPKERLARQLYGIDLKEDEFKSLRQQFDHIRARMINPNDIRNIRNIGWSLGVEEFLLTPDPLRLCYLLWLRKGGLVSPNVLNTSLFGIDNMKISASTRDAASLLRQILENSKIPLEIKNIRFKGYLLEERDAS